VNIRKLKSDQEPQGLEPLKKWIQILVGKSNRGTDREWVETIKMLDSGFSQQ
jgi:hypothetical protein